MKQDPAESLRSLNFGGGTVNTAVPPVETLEGTVPPCPPMIYATASRKLLRGAPGSSRVKKNSFQVIIDCVRKCPR